MLSTNPTFKLTKVPILQPFLGLKRHTAASNNQLLHSMQFSWSRDIQSVSSSNLCTLPHIINQKRLRDLLLVPAHTNDAKLEYRNYQTSPQQILNPEGSYLSQVRTNMAHCLISCSEQQEMNRAVTWSHLIISKTQKLTRKNRNTTFQYHLLIVPPNVGSTYLQLCLPY